MNDDQRMTSKDNNFSQENQYSPEDNNRKIHNVTYESMQTSHDYEDTKEYLGIIMKELEDTKEQLATIHSFSRKKKMNVWKGIAALELICLLIGGSVIGYQYLQDREDNTLQVINQENGFIVDKTKDMEEKTYFSVKKLETIIESVNNEELFPFDISVEKLFGFEYLCFNIDTMKVYYRNEFTNEHYDDRLRILIDNGSKLVEYDWDYDLNGDIKKLCPVLGNFSQGEASQLAFLGYESADAKFPKTISMIDLETLMEYESLDLQEALSEFFEISYSEEIGNDNQVEKTNMTLKVKSVSYTYDIAKEHYINAMYYEELLIQSQNFSSIEVVDNRIYLTAPIYLSEQEFIGEVTGEILLSDNKVMLKGNYGAYAEADQDDPGIDKGILPSKTIPLERVTVIGKGGRRYLIPLFETVALNTKDWNNLVEEGGYKVYYENDVKESIMGIDVSKFQGKIDWEKVKAAGVEYAIIRLGFRGMNEGTLELDPMYLDNIEGATKAGIPVGIYFFSQAITVEEAQEEAKMVLYNVLDYEIAYPIVFDTEFVSFYDARANNLTRKERTDITIAFCEEIKSAGYKTMIYSNTKGMIQGIDMERLTEYDLWFASYSNSVTFPYQFQMLQYSDTGSVPGIEGNVDLNISFIDYTKE